MVEEKITTQCLEILRPNGEVGITLDCLPSGEPHIRIFDSQGCERLVVSVNENDCPQIGLLAEDGSTRIGIGISDILGAGLNIFDRQGNIKYVLLVKENGDLNITESG